MEYLKRLSSSRFARVSLVAGLVVALGFAAGWSRPGEVEEEIMPMLGLMSGELFTIDQDKMGKSEMAFTMGGQDYVMDYSFYSNRSKQFKLLVQQEDGELVEKEAPAVNTIRGTLRGVAGSRVAGCITKAGCCASIEMPTGEKCFIEPLNRTIVDPNLAGVHVVYTEDEVIASGGTCGCETNLAQAVANSAQAPLAATSGSFEECEVAVDADFEYFSLFGSANATLNEIELIVNVVNDQYESEVGIRHTVSRAVIRTTADDPYTSTNPNTLLQELRTEYSGGFEGDICHLFTGKNLDGNIIGLAFVGGVCSQRFGFGLSQDVFPLSDMTDLVAHEIGHNWNQQHCDCPDHTMNASLTGANDFEDTITVPNLISYRNSRTCLDSITTPENDDLAGEIPIDSLDFSVSGSNVAASTEAEEPNLVTIGSSVWWSVNVNRPGTITIDTTGSDFDTQLYVYESDADGGLADLVLVGFNDDSAGSRQSEVTVDVTAGTRYEIRVGGFRSNGSIGDGSEGNIDLNGAFVPDGPFLGDVNLDDEVSFLDITPFIALLSSGGFQEEADFNDDGEVTFSDIGPFIASLGAP